MASPDAKKILFALAKAKEPMGNKQVAELTGLDGKLVSATMSALKKEGMVDSPARCKYGITPAGKKSLKG